MVSSIDSYVSRQGSEYAPGISQKTVGSQVLFHGMLTTPPEGRSKARIHQHHESAFYMLSGDDVELWTSEQPEVAEPGSMPIEQNAAARVSPRRAQVGQFRPVADAVTRSFGRRLCPASCRSIRGCVRSSHAISVSADLECKHGRDPIRRLP